MGRATNSLAWSALCALFIGILSLREIDALLCYCTEDECLSGDRSNMCVQENPELGCYKQYYSKMKPEITMGCVRAALWCDSSRNPPEQYNSEWLTAACCYTDHCNVDLPLPAMTGNSEETTHPPPLETSTSSQTSKPTTEYIASADSYTTVSETESTVHPVFMLVMILVYIFLIVVMASILVIVKVWLYKRKSSSQKRWVIQRNMLHTKAQMSHLLTDEPYELPPRVHQSNSNRVTTHFDVP